ncbi:aldo/keto reductase [Macrococcoides caseolyticum]|uniref:aldo/keto reductase n=1 Tax=Macrococcoides caseolyticum TaxID=69966 RepID=UPI001F2E3EA6|nr:aldo/keto reductase [Macrococcus caseolyticus]MCE4955901.1 aldo/keto reductase [Macrococcus caseolyticus]
MNMSKVVQGFWRLDTWHYSKDVLNRHLHELVDLGVTTMDHADIYGDYTCESIFGEALSLTPHLRQQMQIVTKCGIVLNSKTMPQFDFHKYDYSQAHIEASVERSLKSLHVEEIDLLLLHRPSPLLDAAEVAHTLKGLHDKGYVKHFGVSNFKAHQFDRLNQEMQKVDLPLQYNQLEVSPICLENIEDGTFNHMQTNQVGLMAWSPLAGGAIFQTGKVQTVLAGIAAHYNTTVDDIAYRFIHHLPYAIHPIVGSKNLERTKVAINAQEKKLTDNEWFMIYTAALGRDIL